MKRTLTHSHTVQSLCKRAARAAVASALMLTPACAANVQIPGGNDVEGSTAALRDVSEPYVSAADLSALSGGLYAVSAADVNGDGALDVVGVDMHGVVVAMINPGNCVPAGPGARGVLAAPILSPNGLGSSFVSGSNSFGVADFNGDGRLDIVAGDGNNARIEVALGDGAGHFLFTGTQRLTNLALNSLAVADFDGDGATDVALTVGTNATDLRVELLRNDGTGVFTSVRTVAPIVTANPYAIAAMDINRDGLSDLVLASRATNQIISLTTPFSSPVQAATTIAGSSGTRVPQIADMTGDLIPDVVVMAGISAQIIPGTSTGLGTPLPPIALPIPAVAGAVVGTQPSALTVGDFDGDGLKDLAYAVNATLGSSGTSGQNEIAIIYQTVPRPAPAFSTTATQILAPFSVTGAFPLTSGDLNGDGTDDLGMISTLPSLGIAAFGVTLQDTTSLPSSCHPASGPSACPSTFFGRPFTDEYWMTSSGNSLVFVPGALHVCDYGGSISTSDCTALGGGATHGTVGTWCQQFETLATERVLASMKRF